MIMDVMKVSLSYIDGVHFLHIDLYPILHKFVHDLQGLAALNIAFVLH